MNSALPSGPQMLTFTGPSGSGKSTLMRRLMDKLGPDRAKIPTSYTTRAPRIEDLTGPTKYRFVDRDEFERLERKGEVLESNRYTGNGNLYGMSRSSVEEGRQQGKILMADLDPNGARAVKSAYPEITTSLFILPPPLGKLAAQVEELTRRLTGRKDNPDDIERRVAAARRELEDYYANPNQYDAAIECDDPDRSVEAVLKLLGSRPFQAPAADPLTLRPAKTTAH